MRTKQLAGIIAVSTLTILATTGIYVISTMIFLTSTEGNNKTISSDILANTPSITEPIISEKDKLGRFIILPNNYQPTALETEFIQKNIKTIILDAPSENYASSVEQSFLDLIVKRAGDNLEYTLCNISSVAMTRTSASASEIKSPYLAKGQCNEEHLIQNISKSACNIMDSSCQHDYLITTQTNSYYYNTLSPLLALYSPPSLALDSPFGTIVLGWKGDTDSILQQTGYSYDVLSSTGTRLYASGKVMGANTGDYFSPFFAIPENGMTFKLRLWLQYNTIKFGDPLILSSTYLVQKIPTPTLPVAPISKLSSWIPDWGMQDGIDSVKGNPAKWDTISPVWFVPSKNGKIERKATTNSSTLTKLLIANNIKNIPTISLFDADVLKEILRKNKTKHIDEIIKLVTSNNYDGIDLDYESTYEDDAGLLLEFLTELRDNLHAQGKILIFTAVPKIDDRRIYAFLPQTHQAQDWEAIGAIVDEFRIMAYDYTGQTSLQPGPLSPIDWNETIIRYAISKMPAEKVVLALPLYSHGWPKPRTSNLAGTNNDKSLSSGVAKNTISLQHDSIDYVKSHSAYYKEKYDPVVKEVRAEFKYNGVERVMYYLDKKAVNERITLAKKYGIKGICFWRIGGEKL